jgi:hypothetical protein
LIYVQPRPRLSRYHCQCQIGKDGTSSGPQWALRGIGFDEPNNELHRREIAGAGSRRLRLEKNTLGGQVKEPLRAGE